MPGLRKRAFSKKPRTGTEVPDGVRELLALAGMEPFYSNFRGWCILRRRDAMGSVQLTDVKRNNMRNWKIALGRILDERNTTSQNEKAA